jgi:hypothetical protein
MSKRHKPSIPAVCAVAGTLEAMQAASARKRKRMISSPLDWDVQSLRATEASERAIS